ncbi:Aste57867_14516 [Aphanomyces stellatus]|uniref:Aste57867_14516 protein n=1 Tax=Aphanomyces stellatus TaxID=120398 RepID=A0A485L1Y0_9STRA|nr:hypothetical protein As57867_014462 [Aphanomyces stellatus]VFT91338.1 Aste57867_14516 [Aphanomyces stellatus]
MTQPVDAICFGAGRFLRAVLVPALRHLQLNVMVLQTRGEDFVKACTANGLRYEVDTVERDGSVSTQSVQLAGVSSLGVPAQRAALFARISELEHLRYIGVGVTEAGIHPKSQTMKDLAEFLLDYSIAFPDNIVSVLNTDNVPANGDAIQKCVLACLPAVSSAFVAYLDSHVTFHNTMVDRITAARPGNSLVPYAEPLPRKALVIEDLANVLPLAWATCPGVVVRHEPHALHVDHALKLGIANATHTAMVYCLALSRIASTAATPSTLFVYLDGLFQRDIAPALLHRGISTATSQDVYADWIHRLQHEHFGMDTFFVAQNAWAKYNIRLVSIVAPYLAADPNYVPSSYLVFATACLLRYLTPSLDGEIAGPANVFSGRLDQVPAVPTPEWTYATGLSANLDAGTYTFRDGDDGAVARALQASVPLDAPVVLQLLVSLGHLDGTDARWHDFALDVSVLYNRFLQSVVVVCWVDPTNVRLCRPVAVLDVLYEIVHTSTAALASEDAIAACVASRVANTWVVDVHTHLFPPSHDSLMLWGIDALLTYHYLVAEYLTTSAVSPELFFTWSTSAQADAVWTALFVDRSPLSEACQGVITSLHALGLSHLLARRDLPSIRAWFAAQTPSEYVDLVFHVAKIRYVLMTNIPFEPEEAQYWLAKTPYNDAQFKTALRVDQLLLGDWTSLGPALDTRALPHTLDGIRQYLLAWIEILEPVYFMASVPASFTLADAVPCDSAAVQPSGAMMLQHVLLPLAASLKLPLALKFGALRQLNPRLRLAGDGVAVTDVSILTRLARQNPTVKFLATFLSRVNQHEVTVVANKFGNIHLYGCWWYCNNPSIIQELTRMRLELLGTAFTSQHSDARVLDQLIYKWQHFRHLLVDALVPLYSQLHRRGWPVHAHDIKRDVERLLGQSYHEFLAK